MKKTQILLIMLSIFANSCKTTSSLETVNNIDINKYIGKWYEIAKYPNSFQKNCFAATAEYTLSDKGYLIVDNRCRKNSIDGEESYIKGKAFVVKNSNNTKLKVQFFWPFKGDYWIIGLEENYQWALVSDPNRKYLWILSRSPKMNEKTYNEILVLLKIKGFNLDKIEKTIQ